MKTMAQWVTEAKELDDAMAADATAMFRDECQKLEERAVELVQERELVTAWNRLGPQAQRILLAIARRLVLGAERYGDFPVRPWKKEAAEEALDAAVYLAAELDQT